MNKSVFKIIALLLCAVISGGIFAGCGGSAAPEEIDGNLPTGTIGESIVSSGETEPEQTEPQVTEPVLAVPEISPDKVGIYIPAEDGTKARVLVDELRVERVAKKDIDCFEVIASADYYLSGASFYSIWETAWNGYKNAENAKIGYHIEFTLSSGEVISKTLLKPGDAAEFYDYLEVYMYDDINNANAGFYSHLEDHQIDEDTIISSIKLTAGSKITQVGDITLTAFIYNGDECFDSEGNYIGLVSASVVIPAQGA